MIQPSLIDPTSLVIVGGSNDTSKPGGKVLDNILRGQFQGKVSVLNPKETLVQGVRSFPVIDELPNVDLAILAIPAKHVIDSVRGLLEKRHVRSFIVLSAGFGEESAEGKRLEEELAALVSSAGACLIGPNCIGVLTPKYHGVFTRPIPKLDAGGCDFVSGSGSTACFIMELGMPVGLTFASVFSVGNSAQIGIEEILAYYDDTYESGTSSRVKLVYAEKITKPAAFLKHASSLVRKGCQIAAIKAGTSEAGIRAASSHTGALASSDMAVDALFRRAGVIRCHGKEELVNVAEVLMHPRPKGKRFAIVTNAGGPGVMITDALAKNGLLVPSLPDQGLLAKLHPGSSTANPIDFLATGTAQQFKMVLDHVDRDMNDVDATVAIFGSPGLIRTSDAHGVLLRAMSSSKKPVFAVLPTPATASEELKEFLDQGGIFFRDEVSLAVALGRVLHADPPPAENVKDLTIDAKRARLAASTQGYLRPTEVAELLDACGIPRTVEVCVETAEAAVQAADQIGFPVVLKVIGPIHKSDVGGVSVGLTNRNDVEREFKRMMKIQGATGILIQEMVKGLELFAGITYEPEFGHLILCGLGGILVEALKDVQAALCPLSEDQADGMIRRLRMAHLFQEFRNQKFVDVTKFSDILRRLSALVAAVPEIHEMDINPLMASGNHIRAVDARVRISIDGH